MTPADLVEARESVHLRHADVEEDEVGARPGNEREHLRARLRLADDLELTVAVERAADPVEDEPMVVRDHDSHVGKCGTGPRRRQPDSGLAPRRPKGGVPRAAWLERPTGECR